MVRAGPLWKLLIRCAPKIYIFWKKGDRSSVSRVNGRICGKNLAQDRKYRLTLRFFLKKAVWRWDFGKRPFHAEWRWDWLNPEYYTCTPCRGWSSLHKTRFFFVLGAGPTYVTWMSLWIHFYSYIDFFLYSSYFLMLCVKKPGNAISAVRPQSAFKVGHVFTVDSGVLNPNRKHTRTDGTQPLHGRKAHRK